MLGCYLNGLVLTFLTLVVIVSAHDSEQAPPEKRIFCNFYGCGSKRSSSNSDSQSGLEGYLANSQEAGNENEEFQNEFYPEHVPAYVSLDERLRQAMEHAQSPQAEGGMTREELLKKTALWKALEAKFRSQFQGRQRRSASVLLKKKTKQYNPVIIH